MYSEEYPALSALLSYLVVLGACVIAALVVTGGICGAYSLITGLPHKDGK
jgi:hypothetical protein